MQYLRLREISDITIERFHDKDIGLFSPIPLHCEIGQFFSFVANMSKRCRLISMTSGVDIVCMTLVTT